jgi:hypothetical protein
MPSFAPAIQHTPLAALSGIPPISTTSNRVSCGSARPRSAAVDGLNVMCARSWEQPEIAITLDIVLRLVREGYDVLCIFDANTPHHLEDYRGAQIRDLYHSLLRMFPEHFIQCPARVRADTLILAEANESNALIVSNDRFKETEYRRRYGWIEREQHRFTRIAVVRNHYYFGDLRCPIANQPWPLVRELQTLLPRRARCV